MTLSSVIHFFTAVYVATACLLIGCKTPHPWLGPVLAPLGCLASLAVTGLAELALTSVRERLRALLPQRKATPDPGAQRFEERRAAAWLVTRVRRRGEFLVLEHVAADTDWPEATLRAAAQDVAGLGRGHVVSLIAGRTVLRLPRA